MHPGAPGKAMVHLSEARKCDKTRINDLSINMKNIGVLGFWGIGIVSLVHLDLRLILSILKEG